MYTQLYTYTNHHRWTHLMVPTSPKDSEPRSQVMLGSSPTSRRTAFWQRGHTKTRWSKPAAKGPERDGRALFAWENTWHFHGFSMIFHEKYVEFMGKHGDAPMKHGRGQRKTWVTIQEMRVQGKTYGIIRLIMDRIGGSWIWIYAYVMINHDASIYEWRDACRELNGRFSVAMFVYCRVNGMHTGSTWLISASGHSVGFVCNFVGKTPLHQMEISQFYNVLYVYGHWYADG